MEKKLTLLGFLRDHEMHGYMLNELLEQNSGLPISLKKGNAYKLLNKMEQDGWVSHHVEQEGNRPPRRVYKVTAAGERAFQQMLRDSLAAYAVPEFPSVVSLNFLEHLPAEEAIALLQQRREKILIHLEETDVIPITMREEHPSIAYLWRFFRSEIEWLDEIISQLNDS